jgi:hypothetical protein
VKDAIAREINVHKYKKRAREVRKVWVFHRPTNEPGRNTPEQPFVEEATKPIRESLNSFPKTMNETYIKQELLKLES